MARVPTSVIFQMPTIEGTYWYLLAFTGITAK